MITVTFDAINLFCVVFVRMTGMILLNPMLSRRNMPAMVRMGLVFFLTLLVSPTVDPQPIAGIGDFMFAIVLFKELAIGLMLGLVFQLFYFMLYFTGDMLDVTFGLSMAKVFDPGTNLQVSITSNFLFLFFMLYIFVTDTHLAILHLFCYTYRMLPLGGIVLTPELAGGFVELFTGVFLLVIRLAAPFVAMEFILEVGMGILMKVVPQIHIFVINFQLKQGLGFLMLILFAPYVSSFLDNYIIVMLENMQNMVVAAGGVI